MNKASLKAIGNPEHESMEGFVLDDGAFERIKNLYIAQLTIPDQLPTPPFFLCPIGLVGAGKSTVIKPLAERFHLLRISTDEIRKLLIEHGYNSIRTAELAYKLISDFSGKGYGVAIDADCVGTHVAESISQAANAIGAKIVWVHINPPEEFILNKLQTFQHSWLFKDANDAITNYFRRKPLHQNLNYPFLYTFDTSRPNLVEQLEAAARIIDEYLKDEES